MSCFIMNAESIRKIGYTLADILDSCIYNNEFSIATNAAQCSDLAKAFQIAYSVKHRVYWGEMIAEILHRINAKAYAGRYNEPDEMPFPEYPGRNTPPRSLYRRSEYAEHTEHPQEWHYHLAALLDCWLYQTEEDASRDCPERLAIKAFCKALSREIIQHSPEYNLHRWGE